ncbi:MAG: redoxin family protein [Fimbriiglobus sp.]|jgi:thiol-disulfide isomerase/thioredoxin|nr:redoxin family protein [Fimbriiglobus sp.]
MRKVFAALLVIAAVAAGGFADDKKDDKKAKLAVGDPAPPLTKVTAWLNGPETKAFDKDKVYVLEFWATWCGPCIGAMPHLTELQKANASKGLVVIGVTNKDPQNTQKAVTDFVEKNKGDKLGYAVAYSDGEENYTAYMEAAGQNGIPCSFVVGKDGKVAYIGHPMNLDDVLPKVLDGTWKGKADADRLEQRMKDFEGVFAAAQKSPEAGLEKFAAFVKAYPEKAKADETRQLSLGLLLACKKFDEAKPLGEELIAEADKKKKPELAAAALGFADLKNNPEKKHFDLGLKGLEVALKHADKDIGLLLAAVQVYTTIGDKDKADAYGKKAVQAAPNPDAGKQIEKIIEDIKKMK